MFSKPSLGVLIALTARLVTSQQNVDLTGWYGLRGGTVNHILYLEGGNPTNGGQPVNNDGGFLWKFQYCQPFDMSKDTFSKITTPLRETLDNQAPSYVGGGLFATNNEFYTYGGLAFPVATADSAFIFHAELNSPNPDATAWNAGQKTNFPLSTVNNYVAWGAYTSVPSESLGFFFGGIRSSTFGNISYIPDMTTYADGATNLSDTLISVDMTTFSEPAWTNTSLTAYNISTRTGASLTWIPKSSRGLLIAIGGTTVSADSYGTQSLSSSQKNDITNNSPAFMTEVPVYDVAKQTWYNQKTTSLGSDAPPQILTQHCAVAVTQDSQTFQIYVYGGWNGMDTLNDDVWILSVPSFTWLKAKASEKANHGRRGHFCTAPTDNQLITIGGVDENLLDLKSSIVDVFDMNNLTWTGKYNPQSGDGYIIPDTIRKLVYDTSGSPIVATNMDSGLSAALQTDYGKRNALVKGYPYVSCGNSTNSNGGTKGSSSPSWKTPVIGAVVGVLALAIIGFLLWYFCRPAARKRTNRYSGDSSSSKNRLNRWFGRTTPSTEMTEDKARASVIANEVFMPMSPAQNVIHEADPDNFGYFKAHEIDSNPSEYHGRSPQTTAIGSPGSANTPASEVDGSPRPRYEMGTPEIGVDEPQSFRNHYMYPRGYGGQAQSPRSGSLSNVSDRNPPYPNIHGVSSRAGPISPYELPPNRSDEAVGIDPDADFKLEDSDAKESTTDSSGIREFESMMAEGGSHSTVSPTLRGEGTSSLPYHSYHHRNTSSLNSNTPLLSTISPTEERDHTRQMTTSPTSAISPASPEFHIRSQSNGDKAYKFPPYSQARTSDTAPNEQQERKRVARKSLPRHEEVLEQQRRKSMPATEQNGLDTEAEGGARPKSAYDLNQQQLKTRK